MPHSLLRFVVAAAALLFLSSVAPAAPTTPTADFTDNDDGTVTHKITGLTWKRCAEGQGWTGTTCTGSAAVYTWADASGLTSTFAGASDWRLPLSEELESIVERDAINPSINAEIFPVAPAASFWSSTEYAGVKDNLRAVSFLAGNNFALVKSGSAGVRLVRGGWPLDSSGLTTPTWDFTANTNGTVTHKKTNLIWKRCAEGQTWAASTCSGTAQKSSWADAAALATTFAGFSDWRLPNANELLTIVEWSQAKTAFNPTIFPAMPADFFWTASIAADSANSAWYVHFGNGDDTPMPKRYNYYVRLVRGTQSPGSSTPTSSTGLTGIALSCPTLVVAGASVGCSAVARYGNGTSRKISPIWSVSDANLATISSGVLTAKNVNADTSVTVTASYTEGGVTRTAKKTLQVLIAAPVVLLANLTISGNYSVEAGKTAAYTASAIYGDGSTKSLAGVNWTLTGTAATIDNKGVLTALASLPSDATVTLNASYTEGEITKTAQQKVAIKALPLISGCTGATPNLSAISVSAKATGKRIDSLEVGYCLKNYSAATRFDIYFAVMTPNNAMLFLQSPTLFGVPSFTPYDGKTAPKPYVANTLIADSSGVVLKMLELPAELPNGAYTFYAIPVNAGKELFNGFNWVGALAQDAMTISR